MPEEPTPSAGSNETDQTPKVRRHSVTIDTSGFEPPEGPDGEPSRREVRARLKEELSDLHEHAGFDVLQGTQATASTNPDDDPEAGYSNVRDVRTAKRAVASTGGQFVIGMVVGLIGLGLAVYSIAQANWQSRDSIIFLGVAIVIAGVCFWWAHKKYKAWLQRKTYLYRLLESLGEDVSDMHPRGGRRKLPGE